MLRAWLLACVATAYSAPSADGKWSLALTPEDTGVPWSQLPRGAAPADESAKEHPDGMADRKADGQAEADRERELAKQRRADRTQDRAAKAKRKQRERQQQQAQQQAQQQDHHGSRCPQGALKTLPTTKVRC